VQRTTWQSKKAWTIAILGLAFKPDTDDMKRSTSHTHNKPTDSRGCESNRVRPRRNTGRETLFKNKIHYANLNHRLPKERGLLHNCNRMDELKNWNRKIMSKAWGIPSWLTEEESTTRTVQLKTQIAAIGSDRTDFERSVADEFAVCFGSEKLSK